MGPGGAGLWASGASAAGRRALAAHLVTAATFANLPRSGHPRGGENRDAAAI